MIGSLFKYCLRVRYVSLTLNMLGGQQEHSRKGLGQEPIMSDNLMKSNSRWLVERPAGRQTGVASYPHNCLFPEWYKDFPAIAVKPSATLAHRQQPPPAVVETL